MFAHYREEDILVNLNFTKLCSNLEMQVQLVNNNDFKEYINWFNNYTPFKKYAKSVGNLQYQTILMHIFQLFLAPS